jgi:exonuclease III
MVGCTQNAIIKKRLNKANTKKIVGRLTYSPQKHKQQFTNRLRKTLQAKTSIPTPAAAPSTTIKFGSININGLDLEAAWAIEQFLTKKKFDVSLNSEKHNTKNNYLMQVLAVSETFGRSDQHSTIEPVPGFSLWKTERGGADKGGGGLCIFYKENLTPHQWSPPVPPTLSYIKNERQWLLLDGGKERCAFLHTYLACQSHKNNDFLQWNEDLFHLLTLEALKLRQQGFTLLALGDFNTRVGIIDGLENNTPDTNLNTPMFINFVKTINLIIINTLPISKGLFTRFMDGSGRPGTKAVLDYGMIDADHVHTVTSFVIDSEARFDCGSDHALLEVIITFGPKISTHWSFNDAIKYDFKPNSDFSNYQGVLDTLSSSIPLSQFSSLSTDQMLPHISSSINQSGMKSFGLKVKKKKRGQKLPRSVINLIQTRNETSKLLQHAFQHSDQLEIDSLSNQVQILKAEIKTKICELKLSRRHRLRSKILKADPSRKKFWSFLRNQMRAAGTITGCYDKTGKIVFNQDEVEEAVLDHFTTVFIGQRVPVYDADPQQDQHALACIDLQHILSQANHDVSPEKFEDKVCSPISLTELDLLLGKLANGKSSGYDQIPNELLKHSSSHFKQYLSSGLSQQNH